MINLRDEIPVWVNSPEDIENAVIFPRDWMEKAGKKNGFRILNFIYNLKEFSKNDYKSLFEMGYLKRKKVNGSFEYYLNEELKEMFDDIEKQKKEISNEMKMSRGLIDQEKKDRRS